MAEIHSLVIQHGRDKALQMVDPDDRHLVNIAARILSEENNTMGFSYSGFCQAALPHKRLADDKAWTRRSDRLTLMIEPGRLPKEQSKIVQGEDDTLFVGVPYGSRARLILLYLQTYAVKNETRQIELGRSMRDWLRRMGISQGGKSIRDVKEQATRLSLCKLAFYYPGDKGSVGFSAERIVDKGVLFMDGGDDERQGQLFTEHVTLSETFFNALMDHPVPLWEPAIRELQNSSMALDLYVWLAYRLHVLKKPINVSWAALYAQFGAGYAHQRQFKPNFITSLKLALTVYPDAHIEIGVEGVRLHPSRPAIEKRA